jgi:hypothetical protein
VWKLVAASRQVYYFWHIVVRALTLNNRGIVEVAPINKTTTRVMP